MMTATSPNILASFAAESGTLLAVLTPVVVVPLGAITFSLRALRDQQLHGQREHNRRFEQFDERVAGLCDRLAACERDFVAKEDWLRECLHARRQLERLTASLIRLDAAAATERSHAGGDRTARSAGHDPADQDANHAVSSIDTDDVPYEGTD